MNPMTSTKAPGAMTKYAPASMAAANSAKAPNSPSVNQTHFMGGTLAPLGRGNNA